MQQLIELKKDHGQHKKGERVVVDRKDLTGNPPPLKLGEDYKPLGTYTAPVKPGKGTPPILKLTPASPDKPAK